MPTLGELRNTYAYVHRDFNVAAYKLNVERKQLKEMIDNTPNGQELFGERAATVEIQYNAVQGKLEEYNSFIASYMEEWQAIFDETAAKSNAEAMADYYEDLQKILMVAMRMAKGDTVPGSDEKKLMDYSFEMYETAKNAQVMAQMQKKHKDHDSLWEDEEPKEYANPLETADNTETNIVGPEIYSADEIMSAAVSSGSGDMIDIGTSSSFDMMV